MTVGEVFLSAFLQVLFDRLASVDLMEFARRFDVDDDLEMLETTLSEIQVVLSDAEEKQIKNRAVKRWLDELKHVAYDSEDVLDEFATEALRWKIESESQKDANQVWNLITSSISTCVFSFNMGISSKIKEITKKLDRIAKRRDRLGLREGVGRSSSGVGQRTQTTSLVNESRVYGRERDVEEITELLQSDESSDDEMCVIPIVGMGGAGKTTLAQIVYNDEKVKNHFDLKAWVCVSDEFDVKRITKSILESATKGSKNLTDLDPLQVQLKDELSGKKFLLVLDDMWSEKYNDWDELRKPFRVGAPGSKIIVTTRSKYVASIMGTVPAHDVGLLSYEDCWSLFSKHAFANRELDVHPKLEVIRKKIVEKCRGLPLAAKTLGGLLRSTLDIDKWEDILDNEIWRDDKSDILPVLRLSYHYLPAHLKQCFAYCSIFPKDYEFEKEKLVFLWMAEGFVQTKGQERMEDVGDEYFCDLFQRSFFQQSSRDESNFVMHDLINDLAGFVAGETCFRLEDGFQGNITYNVPKMARHSSYVGGGHDRKIIFEAFHEVGCLRTFLALDLMGGKYVTSYRYLPIQVPHELFTKLVYLRVLCLRGYHIVELPDSIRNLKHLRYLDLSHTDIKCLPESTTTLFNLQTLLLFHCHDLVELPKDMGNLIKLRHLDIRGCCLIEKMPHGIDRLTSLQTLTGFVVGNNSGSRIRELDKLHLRGRLWISNLENVVNVGDAMEANLKNKQHLDELCLRWSSNTFNVNTQYERVLDWLRPHMNIKDVTIINYNGTRFPSWIGDPSFCNIVRLELYNCSKCELLPPLGQLPSLKNLKIHGLHGVKSVGPKFYGNGSVKPFPSLEELGFWNMQGLEEWSGVEEGEEFPRLRKLEIWSCYKLRRFSHRFPSLERLKIFCCEEETCGLLRLPSLCELHLEKCDAMVLQNVVDLSSLTSLHIKEISRLVFLPKGFLQCSRTVEEINITNCFSLRALSNGVGLQHLASLQRLVVGKCPELVSLSFEDTGIPTGLKYLEIRYCDKLEKLPQGLYHLTFLEEIKIQGCPSLVSFPEMGLPSMLRHLEIKECENMKYLFVGMIPGGGGLPTWLEHLVISNCTNLESLPEGMHNQMSLKHLKMEECHSLISFPRGGLPTSLEHLLICNCTNLESLPEGMHNHMSLKHLKIMGCHSLKSFPRGGLPTSLEHLLICNCTNLESMPEGMHNHMSLKHLEILACPSLTSFPKGLHNIISLNELIIKGCPCLTSFPVGGLPTTLKRIEIQDCWNIESLLEGFYNLTSLDHLEIRGYTDLVSFPEGGFFSNTLISLLICQCENLKSLSNWIYNFTSLQELEIQGCHSLVSFPEGGLLTNLKKLCISGCLSLVSFPECLLPTTLLFLTIKQCPNLESLPKRMQKLIALEFLEISECSKLASLSDERLPTMLCTLRIVNCPLLRQQCEKEEGADWPKIAHIPSIGICEKFDNGRWKCFPTR